MATDVFAVPVFFIVVRETLETVVIVSVLLAFLKQTLDGPSCDVQTYKFLRRQVWIGVALGFLLCMIIAGTIIGIWYSMNKNTWEAHENIYEGVFCLLASVIITVMGAALLRIGKMQDKWRLKLAKAVNAPVGAGRSRWWARFAERYAMLFLPFITVLREGVEAVVFIAGVSFSAPPTAVPLPVFVGLLVGVGIGWLMYKGASTAKLHLFLVVSTCLLYLVAAGLFSRGVWHLEAQQWNNAVGGDAAETGNGPGSYDIDKSVWHVNCCQTSGPDAGGWGFFNAIFGWTNSATYGSVISYNLYWIAVIIAFILVRLRETRGRWPWVRSKALPPSPTTSHDGSESRQGDGVFVKPKDPANETTIAAL